MARPRIVEKDYYQFQQALRRAVDNGNRIDVSERGRWKAWVKEHHIKEASFKSFGAGMYEGLQPVIIDQDDEWGGYYMYSKDEEVVLTWVRDPD
jgi:hypothetical protein